LAPAYWYDLLFVKESFEEIGFASVNQVELLNPSFVAAPVAPERRDEFRCSPLGGRRGGDVQRYRAIRSRYSGMGGGDQGPGVEAVAPGDHTKGLIDAVLGIEQLDLYRPTIVKRDDRPWMDLIRPLGRNNRLKGERNRIGSAVVVGVHFSHRERW
jgi:hypothetical protein